MLILTLSLILSFPSPLNFLSHAKSSPKEKQHAAFFTQAKASLNAVGIDCEAVTAGRIPDLIILACNAMAC